MTSCSFGLIRPSARTPVTTSHTSSSSVEPSSPGLRGTQHPSAAIDIDESLPATSAIPDLESHSVSAGNGPEPEALAPQQSAEDSIPPTNLAENLQGLHLSTSGSGQKHPVALNITSAPTTMASTPSNQRPAIQVAHHSRQAENTSPPHDEAPLFVRQDSQPPPAGSMQQTTMNTGSPAMSITTGFPVTLPVTTAQLSPMISEPDLLSLIRAFRSPIPSVPEYAGKDHEDPKKFL
ncbi:predicted GPI-anchored protein 58 [Belonocnema kinseyi]|uniref:predicted GPI-anchored protein 58 n=1 Tax=Belonocnema kinseyi TaxID=2817044 RepID=UPI00143D108E|nr:predicted GPI-anchored protein 58 [Belonocnema kinseyi]